MCAVPQANNCILRNNKTYICSTWFIWSSLRIFHSLEYFFYIFIATCALAGKVWSAMKENMRKRWLFVLSICKFLRASMQVKTDILRVGLCYSSTKANWVWKLSLKITSCNSQDLRNKFLVLGYMLCYKIQSSDILCAAENFFST